MFRVAALCALFAVLATASAAQTIDRIKTTGEIRLGYRQDAAPLSYVDDEGLPNGYSVAVCATLAEALGRAFEMESLELTFVPVDTTNRFAKVVNGEVDLLCGASTITMARREFVDFSIPTYVDGMAVMLPTGADTSFASLNGKKIGVRTGTTTEEALSLILSNAGVAAELVRYDTHEAGLAAMTSGELSAYFADQSILLFLNQGNDDFMVMDRLLSMEKQGLAMLRGDTDFRFMVDGALSGMYGAGIMERIFKDTLVGIQPGQAMQWLYRLGPVLP